MSTSFFMSASEAATAFNAAVEQRRAADAQERMTQKAFLDATKGQSQEKYFEEVSKVREARRVAAAAALPAEFEAARKEYTGYLRDLIKEAIQEATSVTSIGYWELHPSEGTTNRKICMEDFRCERKYCCGEEIDGEPAMLDWQFNGLNSFSAHDFLFHHPDNQYAALLTVDVFTTIKEEMEVMGYTVTGQSAAESGLLTLRIEFPLV
jgi:hypothetical protein